MLLGVVRVGCVIAFSWLVTQALVGVFLEGATLRDTLRFVVAAGVVTLVRAVVTWLGDVAAAVAATRTKMQLRERVVDAVADLGPAWTHRHSSAQVATMATHGLDALDSYFADYLPQLVLTGIATPVFLVVILLQDWISGLIVALTLPLIPVFMVLIGFFTEDVQKKQWKALGALSTHFSDVVRGLSTLKAFGRERHQIGVIAQVTDEYRNRTMAVLRVSFLSGFVLELGSTLAVAMVAVVIGTRLIAGTLTLDVGLFALLITPEAFLPLRKVGANYHAAAEGLVASRDVFELLDAAAEARRERFGSADADDAEGETAAPSAEGTEPGLRDDDGTLEIEHLDVVYPGEDRRALEDFSLSAHRGEIVTLSGPSGAGKSTVFAALLGFVPFSGTIRWSGRTWTRASASWAGQRPGLEQGTIASNVAFGEGAVDDLLVLRCLRLAALDLPPSTEVLPDGRGLSGGQAQRVALARCYYRAISHGLPVILLDEPTSALDEETERRVVEGWEELAAEGRGRVVVAITHRRAVAARADRALRVQTPVTLEGAVS